MNYNKMNFKISCLIIVFITLMSCEYAAIQEYEIENKLNVPVYVEISNSGDGFGGSKLVKDTVLALKTKVVYKQEAGNSAYPERGNKTSITNLKIYVNDTTISKFDYSKNQNMNYYFRNKVTGVYHIIVDAIDFEAK
jgi:hypothetical protein